jgi:ribulose-5-phosphate 4-epimerase/fuculose-1-phosphate aldolase
MSELVLAAEREAVAGASRYLAEKGLVIGTAGNISARLGDLIAVDRSFQLEVALWTSPYATFGSQELADNVIEALKGRNAALMQNHGSVAYGSTMDQAIHRLELLEWLAELYWRASSMGAPRIVTEKDFEAIITAAIEHGYGALKKVDKN